MLGQILQQRLVRSVVVGEIGRVHRGRTERVLIREKLPDFSPFGAWNSVFNRLVEHFGILAGVDGLRRGCAQEVLPDLNRLLVTARNLVVLQLDAFDFVRFDLVLARLESRVLLVHAVQDDSLLDGHTPQFAQIGASSLPGADVGISQRRHVLGAGHFEIFRGRYDPMEHRLAPRAGVAGVFPRTVANLDEAVEWEQV